MYKKLILVCIFILTITVAACKSKNIEDNATTSDLQKDTKLNETEEVSVTEGDKEEDFDSGNEADVMKETDDTKSDSDEEKEQKEQKERKNTYQDIDIKVPSIYED